MKKVILLILSLAVVTSTFSACGDTPATESSSESATSKVIAITTTSEKDSEPSSVATETENVVETTLSVPETQSKIETTVESVNEKKLNLDLLSDIGLTYGEIKAKRGEATQRIEGEGGYGFVFENGYGIYGWSGEEMVFDKNEEIKPQEFAKCTIIDKVSIRDLFLGAPNSITPLEIEEMFGVKYNNTQDVGYTHYGWENYTSSFSFNNINIVIYTKEKDKIDLDSYLFFKIGL